VHTSRPLKGSWSQLQICIPRPRHWSRKRWNNRDEFSYKESKKVGNCLYAFNLDFSPWTLYSRYNLCMCSHGSCKICQKKCWQRICTPVPYIWSHGQTCKISQPCADEAACKFQTHSHLWSLTDDIIPHLVGKHHVLLDENFLHHLIHLCTDHISNCFIKGMNLVPKNHITCADTSSLLNLCTTKTYLHARTRAHTHTLIQS